MKYTIDTLDGRHAGCKDYKYRVWIYGTDNTFINDMLALRKWCTDVYGMSAERDIALRWRSLKLKEMQTVNRNLVPKYNEHWAWHLEEASGNWFYIYLTGDEELSFFKLKWS